MDVTNIENKFFFSVEKIQNGVAYVIVENYELLI
jgi:hypothetical protein